MHQSCAIQVKSHVLITKISKVKCKYFTSLNAEHFSDSAFVSNWLFCPKLSTTERSEYTHFQLWSRGSSTEMCTVEYNPLLLVSIITGEASCCCQYSLTFWVILDGAYMTWDLFQSLRSPFLDNKCMFGYIFLRSVCSTEQLNKFAERQMEASCMHKCLAYVSVCLF